jgi:hypothetical protein
MTTRGSDVGIPPMTATGEPRVVWLIKLGVSVLKAIEPTAMTETRA